jgi:hypothetical protein
LTIEQLAQGLLSLADSYQEIVVGAEEMRILEARADELDAAVERLGPAASAYVGLIGSELVPAASQLSDQAAGAGRTIARARQAFDPADDSPGRADIQVFANAVEQAQKLALDLSTFNRAAWAEAKGRRLPAGDEVLLRVLVRLPPWRHLGQRFSDLAARLRQARDAPLPTQSNAELVRTASEDLRALRTEVAGTSSGATVPLEVVQFLQVLSTEGGAPFAFLTPEVMRWLDDNDVSSSLNVVVSDS